LNKTHGHLRKTPDEWPFDWAEHRQARMSEARGRDRQEILGRAHGATLGGEMRGEKERA